MREKGSSLLSSLIIVVILIVTGCSTTPVPSNPQIPKQISKTSNELEENNFIIPPLTSSDNKWLASNKKDSHEFIWAHLSQNFSLQQDYSHPKVESKNKKYLRETEYLSRVTQRAEPFLYFILSEIDKRQMPAEIALLPVVESNFRPTARSYAHAVGLWQIMPHTAKDLGLKRSRYYDGRHDVYASTHAALDYLSYLHKKFDNDWLLALAAYNAGPQRVSRALRAASNESDKSYWNLSLPRETKEYIPKLLALCSIIKNEEFRKSLLHPIADKPYVKPIEIEQRISPAKLAEVSGFETDEIKKLNPALRNVHYPIQPGYRLLAPIQNATTIAARLPDVAEDQNAAWVEHRIKSGESLSTIAQNYGTTIHAIKNANNVKGNTIVAGRTIIVPPFKFETKNKTPGKKPESKLRLEKPVPVDEPYFYIVAMGDSFWKIAYRNNTTIERLAEINGRNLNQPLVPGEQILVD